jgi:uncharacterized membrane-anchored protein YitT (DUF2179 family)
MEILGLSTNLLEGLAKAASELPFMSRHKLLSIIITNNPQEVSESLLHLLKRGVTALEGKGMYTGSTRSVLFCAVAPSEIKTLKAAVYSSDENAFVVVNPTDEIWGGSFDSPKKSKRTVQKGSPQNKDS